MENSEEHIRHDSVYYFKKWKKPTEERRELRWLYGWNFFLKCKCQNWVVWFCGNDFSVEDAQRSGSPSDIDDDEINALVEENEHSITQAHATALKVFSGSLLVISNCLVSWRFSMFWYRMNWKIFIWRSVWTSAIKSPNENKTILSGSVWSRLKKNGLSTTMKAKNEIGVGEIKHWKVKLRRTIHQKKMMLSIWRYWKGPVAMSYFHRIERLIPMPIVSRLRY